MSLRKNLRGYYTCGHRRLADLFSLLAVLLLFLFPYLGAAYDGTLNSWMNQDDVLRLSTAVTLLTADMLLIFFLFLGLGTSPFDAGEVSCFHARYERCDGGSPGLMFNNRFHPLEQVGREHC